MKEAIETVDLLNRETQQFEPAILYRGIDKTNLDDFDRRWRPLIDVRIAQMTSPSEIAAANIQDWHWDWRDKAKKRTGQLASDSFAVEIDGITQGLLFTTSAAFARIDEQKGLDIVYLEYLATAPWNRKGFTTRPIYKGVGRVLVAAAISLSHDLGFQGRIGLHSIPQSESWYRDTCGMNDLGVDMNADHRGVLRYFEMTSDGANAFISS